MHLRISARDPQITARLSRSLQAADQRAKPGTVHKTDPFQVENQPSLTIGNQVGKITLDLSSRQQIQATFHMHDCDPIITLFALEYHDPSLLQKGYFTAEAQSS
jgi:hypothetical protein